MKRLIVLFIVIVLSGCMEAGKFTPERHAQYEQGNPDCTQTPEKCIHGVPW